MFSITNKIVTRGILWFLLSLMISVTNDSIVKHLGSHLNEYQIIFLRFALSTIMLIPIIVSQYEKVALSDKVIHFIRGVMTALAMLIWCYGLQRQPLAAATIVGFTIPFFILFLSKMILKEHLSINKIIVCIIGFFAAIIATSADFSQEIFVIDNYFMIGAIIFALLDVFNKKYIKSCDNILVMMFITFLVASFVTMIPAIYYWQEIKYSDWPILIILALGNNAVLFALIKSFNLLELSVLAPFRFIELAISLVFGFMFFGEIPTTYMIIGGVITAIASIVLVWQEFKEKKNFAT